MTTTDDAPLMLFDLSRSSVETHASRPLSFSPYPLGKRHPKARPSHFSRIPRGTDIAAAVLGSELLGLPLLPQGEQVAALLEARGKAGTPLYPTCVVMMPRRSTKTTSIWAVVLGRCASRPGYKVVTTAQDGIRARNRFREVARALEAAGFEGRGLGRIRWANGDEAIEFTNGSRIWVVPPEPAAFRGEAADLMLFDEAGELSAEKSDDLVAGALPLMDTRPHGQVVITGTPAKGRAGLLWETLETGRDGKAGTGILEYSAGDDEPTLMFPDGEDGEPALNVDLLRRVHPGIGTLTTLATIVQRFEKMSLTQFEMEYLCRFPADTETDAISPEQWAALAVPPCDRPERVGIAFDCAYDGSSASIAYAWRDDDGTAYVELVAHRLSTAWVPHAAHQASTSFRRAPIGHDDIGANRDPSAALARMRPAPRLDRLQVKDIMGASSRLVNEVHAGRVRHFGQADLDDAIRNLTWRDVGKSGRAFGPKSYSAAPINPIVACALALWQFDRMPKRTRVQIVA